MELLDQRGLLDAARAAAPNGPDGPLRRACPSTWASGRQPVPGPVEGRRRPGSRRYCAEWAAGLGRRGAARARRSVPWPRRRDRVARRSGPEVRTGPGELRLGAAFVVGCDGEDSTVRRLAGFAFPGAGRAARAAARRRGRASRCRTGASSGCRHGAGHRGHRATGRRHPGHGARVRRRGRAAHRRPGLRGDREVWAPGHRRGHQRRRADLASTPSATPGARPSATAAAGCCSPGTPRTGRCRSAGRPSTWACRTPPTSAGSSPPQRAAPAAAGPARQLPRRTAPGRPRGTGQHRGPGDPAARRPRDRAGPHPARRTARTRGGAHAARCRCGRARHPVRRGAQPGGRRRRRLWRQRRCFRRRRRHFRKQRRRFRHRRPPPPRAPDAAPRAVRRHRPGPGRRAGEHRRRAASGHGACCSICPGRLGVAWP